MSIKRQAVNLLGHLVQLKPNKQMLVAFGMSWYFVFLIKNVPLQNAIAILSSKSLRWIGVISTVGFDDESQDGLF